MWLVFLLVFLYASIAGIIIWLGTGVLEGFMDAKKRPTIPMEWCHKHGFFKKEHVLEFMETTVCPRCYYEAFKKVEK